VRHPVYGGLATAALGWSLLMVSPPALLLTGALAIFFDLKVRRRRPG
jgi:protein-S-isoprenylcysteine O-methyltransferase Ste14